MKKALFASAILMMIAGTSSASAQSKSCYDQWYDLRVKALGGQVPTGRGAQRAMTPNAAVREDIATCEASKDKKFKRIKSLRQTG
jgi:hypothetical protein